MLGFSHTRLEVAIIFSILFETPYRFESVRVCVCGFIFPSHYLEIFFFFSFRFSFVFSDRPLEKQPAKNFLVSFSSLSPTYFPSPLSIYQTFPSLFACELA